MRLGDCGKTNLHTYSDKEKWSLIRYLDTGSITEGRIDEIQTLYPGVDKIPSRARRKASVGDILFSTVRPNQKHYGIIEAGTENLLVSTGFTVVTVDTTIADPYFIYYYLTQSSVIESLQAIAEQSTSTYPSIKPSDIEDIELDLPELETQKKIGSTLRMLDRKIALNEEINDNLQQMAYDTFMHSFFRKESNGKLGDIIVENAKSPIQVGDAKAANNGDIPFFTSGDAILKCPEVLATGRNCYLNTGGNADVKFYVGDAAYSTDTWCITASGEMSDYLYLLLLSIKPELNQKYFQGTGLKHLQKPMLKDRPIYIPATKELETFNKTVQPWFDMIASNVTESQSLVALRDWLLPMLMNGQAVIED